MTWRIPRLDTYIAPHESAAKPPAAQSGTSADLESTLADISDEVTREAILRRKVDAPGSPTK